MAKLTQFDLDHFLSEPIYSWNAAVEFSGVIDFLEFAEGNLAWQRRRAVRKAQEEGSSVEFDTPDKQLAAQYREHLVEAAEYLWDVVLSQRIRYAGLVAFISTVESCAKAFCKRLLQDLPPRPNGENKSVHLLEFLNDVSSSRFEGQICDLRRLMHVRNCVVHAGGFLERYKWEDEVRKSATALRGFSIWEENFLGTSIHIEEGPLEQHAKAAAEWLPLLDKKATVAGILKA